MSVEANIASRQAAFPELSTPDKSTVQRAGKAVVEKGDVLDQMSRIRRVRPLGPIAAIGTAGIAYDTQVLYNSLDTLASKGVIAAGTLIAIAAARPLVRKIERRKIENAQASQELLRDKAGTTVEVYRVKEGRLPKKKKKLALRWYGEITPDTPPAVVKEQLGNVGAVSTEIDANAILLPHESVKTYLPSEDFGQSLTQAEWLRSRKKRKLKDRLHGDDALLVVTNEELKTIVEKIDILAKNEPLDSIMHVLRHTSPKHMANELYSFYVRNPKEVRIRLKKNLKTEIEKNLDETTHVRRTEPPITRTVSVQRKGRLLIAPGLKPMVEFADVETTGNKRRVDLFRAIGITPEQMRTVLMNPQSFPPAKVRQICEYSAWLTLEGVSLGLTGGLGLEKAGQIPVNSDKQRVQTFQDRVAEQEKRKRKERKKKGKKEIALGTRSISRRLAKSGAILLVGAAVGLAAGAAEKSYQDQYLAKYDKLSNALRAKDPHSTTIEEEANRQAVKAYPLSTFLQQYAEDPLQVLDDMVFNSVAGILEKTGYALVPQDVQKYVSENSQKRDCEVCDAQVGNVTPGANSPVWYLQPYNGMKTDGYWAENSYHVAYLNEMAWRATDSYPDKDVEKAIADAKIAPLPAALDKKQPAVQVERAIFFDGLLLDNSLETYKYIQNEGYLVRVPVLNGTHIAAASVDGNGAKVVDYPDGTHGMIVPITTGIEKIEYWLTPGETKPVTATLPIEPTLMVNAQSVQTIWEKALGAKLPKDPVKRLLAEEQYITTHFDYRLSPLKDNEIISDRLVYTKAVLDLKLANCNVANSLLATSNPDLVNPVSGYLNSNDPSSSKQYLSSNETHLYTVDAKGTIYDATPGNILPAEKSYFAENFGNQVLQNPADQRRSDANTLFEGFALASAAGATFWQRKRIRDMYLRGSKIAAKTSLNLMSTNTVAASYDALNHEFYSSGLSDWNNTAAESLALEDAMRGETVTRADIFERVSAYADPADVVDYSDRLAVAATTPMYTKEYKRALKRAKRIINTKAKIQKLEEKLVKSE